MGTAKYKRSPGPQTSTNRGLDRWHRSELITCTGTFCDCQYFSANEGEANAALLSWICRDTVLNSAVHAPSVKNGGKRSAQMTARTRNTRIIEIASVAPAESAKRLAAICLPAPPASIQVPQASAPSRP